MAMNSLNNRSLKKLLFSLIGCILVVFIAIFIIAHHTVLHIQKAQSDEIYKIMTAIHEKYPDSVDDVMMIIQNHDDYDVEEGKELLAKYGIEFDAQEVIGNYQDYEFYIISIFCVIIAFFTFFVLLLIYLYLKQLDNSLLRISEYINRLLNKDYSLDIVDNDEGSLSALKNDIYKVTVMIKEQNEILKQDKMLLANNLADISHQLKTPLTSMMLMSDLLEQDLPAEERQKFLSVIKSQLKRIEWLVSSLLKLSKLDAKTIEFKKNPIHAVELIKKSIEPVSMLMDSKQQSFLILGDNPLVYLDVNWTSEAFVNIIKNCSEHTPEKGILKAEVFDNVLYTEFVLSDNGCGIDTKELPFIFERFYRCKGVDKDSVGIGLAMAYSIITSQDGTITVSSTLNVGTSFSIRFYKK